MTEKGSVERRTLFSYRFTMENTKKSQATGIFWAALSVVCWSTLFPAVSFLLNRGNVDCYTMGQIRFVLAGIIMLVVYSIAKRTIPVHGIQKADWLNLIVQSIFAAGMSCSLFYGQSLGLPVVNAAMLEAEAPLLIFILGIFILHNKTSLLQTMGLVFGFGGSLFVLKVISADGFMIKSFTSGDTMVVIGAVCWALYTVLSNRTIKRIGGLLYTGWSVLFAGLWILIFQLLFKRPCCFPTELQDLVCTFYLGLIPTALAFFAWNNAQRYISTGLLAISGYFTPILTALLGWLLFREKITWIQGVGMFLVIGSALIEPEISDLLRSSWKKLFHQSKNP